MKWILSALLPMLFLASNTDAKLSDEQLFSANDGDKVYFVPQFSDFKEISEQDMLFFKKVLKKAERDRARAVIVELDTPGGRIDVALRYVSIMAKSEVPVITYLNPQGISAGMIIAMASDRIAINPSGVIGDAMPMQIGLEGAKPITEAPPEPADKKTVNDKKNTPKEGEARKEEVKDNDKDKQPSALKDILKELQKLNERKSQRGLSEKDKALADQKFLTVYFKILQVLAEKNNRPVRVVRAMADPYQRLSMKEDGIEHVKDSPLTLSAGEALKLGVVDAVVRNKHELMSRFKLTDCQIITMEKSPTEQIMAFLSHPALAGLLLIIGIIGIYVEVRTPGFGVPGALGVTALTLFFLGHMASGASDWGPIVIFFVGVILLALELFVIPGFGIVGFLGLGCIIISMFAAFGIENIETAANVVGLSFLLAILIITLLTIYVLPKSTLFKRIMLTTEQRSSAGYSAPHQENSELTGRRGTAHTPLRPAGTVIIEGRRYDATSESEFIDKGCEVEVTGLNGFQIVVKEYNNNKENA